MTTINPWINFNGNAEVAFNFYRSVFGGEFTKVIRFKDLPSGEHISETDAQKIFQIILPLGDGHMLIANDVPEVMGKVNEMENRSKIYVGVDSKEEADKISNGLSVEGELEGIIGDTPWGTYGAIFRDKFGIEWIVEFNPNK